MTADTLRTAAMIVSAAVSLLALIVARKSLRMARTRYLQEGQVERIWRYGDVENDQYVLVFGIVNGPAPITISHVFIEITYVRYLDGRTPSSSRHGHVTDSHRFTLRDNDLSSMLGVDGPEFGQGIRVEARDEIIWRMPIHRPPPGATVYFVCGVNVTRDERLEVRSQPYQTNSEVFQLIQPRNDRRGMVKRSFRRAMTVEYLPVRTGRTNSLPTYVTDWLAAYSPPW